MDILYIVGEEKSKCDNYELRYSLRSIEKHGCGVGRVFVCGYCPEWLSDRVVKVPWDDVYKRDPQDGPRQNSIIKHCNILNAILRTVDSTDIGVNDGGEFLVSMDDHIYIKDTDFSHYPFYCKKFRDKNELPDETAADTTYKKLLLDTRLACESQGLSTLYLTLHRNMHLCRRDIQECRPFLNKIIREKLAVEPYAYLNNYRLTKHEDFTPTVVRDVKLKSGEYWWRVDPKKTEVFSTKDFVKGSGLDLLIAGLFPKKSKYEK